MCPIQKIFRQQEVDGLAAAKMLMKNVKNGLEFNCYHLRPFHFSFSPSVVVFYYVICHPSSAIRAISWQDV